MSVRDYAVLYLGGGRPQRSTAGGGNTLLTTAAHRLDGPEHLATLDVVNLDATGAAHGLLPKLSGSALDALLGDGTYGFPLAVEEDDSSPSVAGVRRIQFDHDDFSVTDNLDGSVLVAAFTSGAGLGLPWFMVTDPAYGATGDGTTDDTAAINLAIAALNTATRGVLYVPAGTYKCTSALTAITAACTVLGDGMTGSYDGATLTPTRLLCSSGTATFLTIGAGVHVRDIGLYNTAGSVTAGYGIGGTDMNMSKFEDVSVVGFWINFDIDGGLWAMTRCYSRQSHKYGVDVSYVASPDGGDWSISDSYMVDGANSSDAAIHVSSGGGMRIVNNKINSNSSGFATGIDVSVTTGVNSGVIQLSNNSIEGIRGDATRIVTTGTATIALVTIGGLEAAVNNNAGRAVLLNASSAGAISGVAIGGSSVFATSGTARAAIELINTDKVDLGHFQLVGFNARYTSTGDTNTTDGGGLGNHTHAATGSGSNGGGATLQPGTFDFPAATSPAQTAEGRAVWDSDDDKLTVGTGSARKTLVNEGATTASGLTMATARILGRTTAAAGAIEELTVGTGLSLSAGSLSATGSAPTEAQVYGVGGHWEVLMDPATSSPPVPLTTPDGSDWVYGWISDGG